MFNSACWATVDQKVDIGNIREKTAKVVLRKHAVNDRHESRVVMVKNFEEPTIN